MKVDQVLPLNYCAHAIEDLRELEATMQHAMPQSASVLQRLITMLQNSVKFILPNCCNLLEPDDVRQAHIDLVRLPYPCVAFEAPWDKGEAGPDYMGEFQQSTMTKRIALCWDTREFEPMAGLNTFFDAFEEGGVFVLPLYSGPEHKRWNVALGGAFIPYGMDIAKVNLDDALPATKIANAAKVAAGHAHAKSMQIRAEPFPILPELYEHAIARYGSREKANAQIIIDYHDEVMLLIQACSVINCANVSTAEMGPSAAINKKRHARGKQPFFTYKVLELADDRKPGIRSGELGGHHASPRMHLRRGHLRRLERQVIWVRPTMINAESPRGLVHKDYSVGPPRSD